GPVRTRRFLVHIPGISMKSLRQRLQSMEDAGLVKRTQYEGRPLKVEYSITAKGKRTIPLITVIRKYGLEMMKEKGISTEKEGIGNKRKSRK
ncbi:MAG TPA: winged helix-turn-helix transcriptional regulator, partial [Acidobacteriota bacterium]|nr:winged helix-turn-helix transcriptional regulator [Acidobacteriota bacterium]